MVAALEARLRGRGTDSAEEIEKRLRVARSELAAAPEFDYAVVNDDLERCVQTVLAIVRAEREGDTATLRREVAGARARARRGRRMSTRAAEPLDSGSP